MEVKSISKSYGDKVVLDDVSFVINKGEIVGLVGNNGAGKSTLMKIMSNTLLDYEGTVDDRHRVGYFIENPKLYENKTGLWHLKYFTNIYGGEFDINPFQEFLEEIGLLDVLKKKVKTYSLGMREKLGVMISMLNSPEFVILDEPTNGLDLESSIKLLENIKRIADKKEISFLISSHKLEDIESVCDRILFLNNTKITEETNIGEDTVNEVRLALKNIEDVKLFVSKQKLGQIINVNGKEIFMETDADYVRIRSELMELNIEMENYSSEKKTLRRIYIERMMGRS